MQESDVWLTMNFLSTVIAFPEFPMPKTLTVFALKSNYVGLGLMCKHHTNLWCSTTWKDNTTGDYNKLVPQSMTPEEELLH